MSVTLALGPHWRLSSRPQPDLRKGKVAPGAGEPEATVASPRLILERSVDEVPDGHSRENDKNQFNHRTSCLCRETQEQLSRLRGS